MMIRTLAFTLLPAAALLSAQPAAAVEDFYFFESPVEAIYRLDIIGGTMSGPWAGVVGVFIEKSYFPGLPGEFFIQLDVFDFNYNVPAVQFGPSRAYFTLPVFSRYDSCNIALAEDHLFETCAQDYNFDYLEVAGQMTDGATATLTAVLSVPEPASWALLIAGFGLTGAALRHRRGLAVRPA